MADSRSVIPAAFAHANPAARAGNQQNTASSPRTASSHRVESWQTRLRHDPTSLRVHVLGIGGVGVGPIARVLLQMGVQVSGSDRQTGPATAALTELGAQIFSSQAADNLLDLDADQRPHLVLISSAVAPENLERAAAAQLEIPVVKRVDFLPVLLAERQTIAVAGTHGKTTTTGMIAHILQVCGKAPGYIIGAEVSGLGSAAAGASPYFVIEADEYDYMFLGLYPAIAVVTNVEWDHPDCFPTAASFAAAFQRFLAQVQTGGQVISCRDDAGVETLRRSLTAPANLPVNWVTYGITNDAHAESGTYAIDSDIDNDIDNGDASWSVFLDGQAVGRLQLQVPGLHNVRNALAALTATQLCGVPAADALAALASFRGSRRRFEVVGEANGVTIIDDYAHHPTEVATTLAGARSRYPNRTIHAVFQPHTFSRTRLLLQAMAQSFADADHALITDIYAAREQDDGTTHARMLVEASDHPHMEYSGNLEQTTARLIASVQPGDVVITLSAGDGNQTGQRLLAHLRATNSGTPESGTPNHVDRSVQP